ncbi:hypothetical protein pdam_00011086 [Pocillopora damicornis]|uniref:Uncharacterized protein n=1 Tax=Pocillopora damicornis TaxID=46731 RepID=A0A3M6UTP5_POCDA|nr:hypothetical protein pdam_00011086 [Pocillopora damicornis]
MVYQDQGRNHRKSHIVSHVVDVENACDVIVISLAKYHLKVEEKLVADAESVLADVTGEAIKEMEHNETRQHMGDDRRSNGSSDIINPWRLRPENCHLGLKK